VLPPSGTRPRRAWVCRRLRNQNRYSRQLRVENQRGRRVTSWVPACTTSTSGSCRSRSAWRSTSGCTSSSASNTPTISPRATASPRFKAAGLLLGTVASMTTRTTSGHRAAAARATAAVRGSSSPTITTTSKFGWSRATSRAKVAMSTGSSCRAGTRSVKRERASAAVASTRLRPVPPSAVAPRREGSAQAASVQLSVIAATRTKPRATRPRTPSATSAHDIGQLPHPLPSLSLWAPPSGPAEATGHDASSPIVGARRWNAAPLRADRHAGSIMRWSTERVNPCETSSEGPARGAPGRPGTRARARGRGGPKGAPLSAKGCVWAGSLRLCPARSSAALA